MFQKEFMSLKGSFRWCFVDEQMIF